MSEKRPIVERFLSGEECDLTRIDGEIDAWHETETTIPLHEWLGLTLEEYQLYVESLLSRICGERPAPVRRQGCDRAQFPARDMFGTRTRFWWSLSPCC